MERLRKGELPPLVGVTCQCKLCLQTLDESLFKWQGGKRQGRVCRACDLAKKKADYANNDRTRLMAITRARANYRADPTAARERAIEYRAAHQEQIKARRKTYHVANREHIIRKARDWVIVNSERHKARCREYCLENNATIVEKKARYWIANKNKLATANSAWQKANRGLMNAYYRAYTMAKAMRTPAWASQKAIRKIYTDCPAGHDVDHIVPLFGRLVCGLHVENNLQWLPASVNRRKGNKHDPMEFEKWNDKNYWKQLPPLKKS